MTLDDESYKDPLIREFLIKFIALILLYVTLKGIYIWNWI